MCCRDGDTGTQRTTAHREYSSQTIHHPGSNQDQACDWGGGSGTMGGSDRSWTVGGGATEEAAAAADLEQKVGVGRVSPMWAKISQLVGLPNLSGDGRAFSIQGGGGGWRDGRLRRD